MVSVTGTRADYGLMEPVHRAIAADLALELHLIVTAMHFLPAFASSLAEVREHRIGTLHELQTMTGDDSAEAMAASVGRALVGMSRMLAEVKPDIVLLQGDRGEMLAGGIAAAHMNVPIVHMSGGDASGSIDEFGAERYFQTGQFPSDKLRGKYGASGRDGREPLTHC